VLQVLLREVDAGNANAARQPAFAKKMHSALVLQLGRTNARATFSAAAGAMADGRYRELAKAGRARRRQKVYEDELNRTASGAALLRMKPCFGLAWYLATAVCSVKFGRSLTLYRVAQLRCGAHNLGSRVGYYAGGSFECVCGNPMQTPAHVLCGDCPRTAVAHERWLQAMEDLLTRGAVWIYRNDSVDGRWMRLNSWLNGRVVLQRAAGGLIPPATGQAVVSTTLDYVRDALAVMAGYADADTRGPGLVQGRREVRGHAGGTSSRVRRVRGRDGRGGGGGGAGQQGGGGR